MTNPDHPSEPTDAATEQQIRRALADAVADVQADDRLHALVDERRAGSRTSGSPRPWLVAAAVLVVLAGVGALIAVDRASDDRPEPTERVATEPPVDTTTTPGATAPTTDTTALERFGTWGTMSAAPIGPRTVTNTASVWTGAELIVWGEAGSTAPGADNRSGAAYDPANDTWRTIAPSPVLAMNAAAAWTGTEMLVGPARPLASADDDTSALQYAAYDPAADSWRVLSGTVDGFGGRPVLWAGTEVLLDGGQYGDPALTLMDARRGTQVAVPDPPPPAGDLRGRPTGGTTYVAMDGGRVAAISDYQSSEASLAISNEDLTAWTQIEVTGIDPTTLGFPLVWTGEELMSVFPGGAAYDPDDGTWRQIAELPELIDPSPAEPGEGAVGDSPGGWAEMPPVFTGRYVVAWFGVYDVFADRWIPADLGPTEVPSDPVVAWDGTKVLIWSGMLPCVYVDGACTTPESELFPATGITFQP